MNAAAPTDGPSPHKPGRRAVDRACLLGGAAIALHVGIMVCFAGRWDATAALTIIPIWAWSLLGLALSAAARLAARSWEASVAGALWLATLLLAPDEWHGLRRAVIRTTPPPSLTRPPPPADTLRVVTHNCRAGNIQAARQAASWNPDVLLLQETRAHLAGPLGALGRTLWGDAASVLFGHDTAILARGRLTPSTRPVAAGVAHQFLQATLTLPDGRTLEIASVHLQGHVTDLRLWKPPLWRAHARNQQRHRTALDAITRSCLESAANRPCLIGGDFNSPANDRAFRALHARFLDSFATAGVGWGNTFRNDWPVLRIDQVWATTELIPHCARTVPARHSDHRLVVVDYVWPGGGGREAVISNQ